MPGCARVCSPGRPGGDRSGRQHDAQNRQPSALARSLLHTMIYRSRPDVQAIVHAHPPTAIAATLAGVKMDAALLPEIYLALGPVPTAPYALMGTVELVNTVTPLLDSNAILLSHHGAVTMGESFSAVRTSGAGSS
ncbi:MAG: class II aldolase/adducin family protein, partial [Blastochloris sp.]|nr:class II aldolase/adducin family protein [Blastochloris sp.]